MRAYLTTALAVTSVFLSSYASAQDAPAAKTPTPEPAAAAAAPEAGETSAVGADEHGPLAKDGFPLSGYHNGVFYLRDVNDNFRLYVQGRMQIDFYSYFGPGVADTGLKDTLLLRRIRPELSGEFLKHWQWMLAGDFGQTSVDNTKGTTQTSAAAPGAAPTAASGKFASAETASIKAAVTDVFINYRAAGALNFQLGQYDAPFMMENRTSDKYLPFMERSLAVRNVGIPTNKEIGLMGWGETREKHFAYALGVFMGDGQNRLNQDNRFDFMGRVFVHPLATAAEKPLKDLQLGVSVRDGVRDKNYVNYDYNAMSTQGNYTFWSPIYGGSKGNTHVLPSGSQFGVAAEARIPISLFDLTAEFVDINNGTRESVEGFQATNSERFGSMKGYSYYVELGFWPIGNRDVNGLPGYENPTHVDFSKPDSSNPLEALQILFKWEQMNLTYASASRSGTPDAKNIDGDIKVNAFSAGVNLWLTKHVRLTVNYVLNMFPDSAPVKATTATSPAQTADQRALAPGNTLPAGVNDTARDSASVLHELLFRAAVAF